MACKKIVLQRYPVNYLKNTSAMDYRMANLGDFTWLRKAKHTVHLTFVTTYGLTVNVYSGHIRSCITADDLFKISE